MHDGSRAEPVLVAYGITTVGRAVLLAVEPGGDESCDAWAGFLEDLTHRGLRPPLLVVSDGAPGLIAAIETKMPVALRQRCLAPRARMSWPRSPPVAATRYDTQNGLQMAYDLGFGAFAYKPPRNHHPSPTRSPTLNRITKSATDH